MVPQFVHNDLRNHKPYVSLAFSSEYSPYQRFLEKWI